MKDFRQRFVQKVKANGNTLEHDLSNEEDYQYLMSLLGGEENLEKKYPLVAETMRNTKAFHERRKSEGYVAKTVNKSNVPADGIATDYENSSKIRYVNLDENKLATASSMHRTGLNPCLAIMCSVYDKTHNNKRVDGFAITKPNATTILGTEEQPSIKLIKTEDRELQVESTFMCQTYDNANNRVFESKTAISDVIKVRNGNTFVEKVVVNDPYTQNDPTRPNTVIVYDRQAIVHEQYDYYFPLVSQGNNVRIKIPFTGSATFQDGITVIGVDQGAFKLQLEHPTFGVINFNKMEWNKIQWNINGSKLSWQFPEDWNTLMNKKAFGSGIGFDFYCEMPVNVELGGIPLPVPIILTFTSDNLDHDDPSFKKVKPVDIYWGCIGKDTKIKMADGSLKCVSEIQPGEHVQCAYGEIAEVKNNMSGHEEKMIQVEVKSGDSILLTNEHPILTERGMVMAKDLRVADVLILENEKTFLTAAYKVEYNDTVYNPVLDKPNAIIGNNFIIGDFDAQQKAMAQAAKIENTEMALTDFQKEVIGMYKEINAILKQQE